MQIDESIQNGRYINEAMVTGSIVFTEALTKEAKPIENLIKMGALRLLCLLISFSKFLKQISKS